MSEYKEGKWYGWNGDGDCPVHPLSRVRAVATEGKTSCVLERPAGEMRWFKDTTYLDANIVAFMVVEEYREPREFWIEFFPNGTFYYFYENEPEKVSMTGNKIIKVVEKR